MSEQAIAIVPAIQLPPETPEQFDKFISDPVVRAAEFDSLFADSNIPTAAVGLGGRFLRVNGAYCRLLKYSPNQLTELSYRDVTHHTSLGIDDKEVQQLLDGKRERYTLVKVYLASDNEKVQVELTVWLFKLDGIPMHFLVQAPELRLDTRHTKVVYDKDGKPILQPHKPLVDLIVEYRKWLLTSLAPIGFAGWLALREYSADQAKTESVAIDNTRLIQENEMQEEQLQAMQLKHEKDRRSFREEISTLQREFRDLLRRTPNPE